MTRREPMSHLTCSFTFVQRPVLLPWAGEFYTGHATRGARGCESRVCFGCRRG